MRRLALALCVLALAWLPLPVAAQPPAGAQPQPQPRQRPQEAPTPQELEDEEEDVDEEVEGEELEEPRLRPPAIEPLDIEVREEDVEESVEETVEDPEEFPSPGEAAEELEESAPPSSDITDFGWTAPQPVLTLHGYFRVRAEMWDTFWLGRRPISPATSVEPPFGRFVPIERRGLTDERVPEGGCGEDGGTDAACDTEALAFANMRLRLEPTISLSDDVRVHMMFDVLDNVVLGSTPDGLVTVPTDDVDGVAFERVPRTPRVPLDSFTGSAVPPMRYRNSLSDSIVVRRAWGEVTNRGLGQLRFGRMGSHWGLGLLANGGEGIDSDFQTDVDRIMAITKLAGFYLAAAWDFASEGFIDYQINDPSAIPVDLAQEDDVDQYVFAVARRTEEEEARATLQRGGFVLDGGLYFVYRNHLLSAAGVSDWYGPPPGIGDLVRRDAEAFIPDLWVKFLWGDLRIEAEAVLIAGSIENTEIDLFEEQNYDILQFGAALESEYRLLDDKLGIYFDTGFATGDQDVEGLAAVGGLLPQQNTDDTISTFRFHPNYRVDLILWRNIMQQVSAAYYFKPGLSYDFIRNAFGQLFGLRADVIWSRATAPVQTPGNDPDLGLEINARLYYRSEDGPEVLDGFYGSLQYGILFPLGGLGYLEDEGRPQISGGNPDLENAQILRLILGVQY